MSMLSFSQTVVPWVAKAAGCLNRSGLLSPRVDPPVRHRSSVDVPPPTKMALKNQHVGKRWVLHGSLSSGLNWLHNGAQPMRRERDGTPVSLIPVIHRGHFLPKVPLLSLCAAEPGALTGFKDRCYSKLRVLHGSHSTGLKCLSNDTQQDGTSERTDPVIRRTRRVSEILKVPVLSLYNAPPLALTDFKNRCCSKRWVLHGGLSTGLNWLCNESQPMKRGQDGTLVSFNAAIHRSHPGSERLKLSSLSLFMSLCLCPDIPGTAKDPAGENIKTVHGETPQPARMRLAGIVTLISAARARMKAVYSETKARITAVYSMIRARILASMSELQLVFLSEEKMYVLPSEGKVLLVFPRKETKLLAIFKESGKRVSYTLPGPVDRMWLRFLGPNRELYLSLPQSMLEVTLSLRETEDLQLFFEESDVVLQLCYQGPMARIPAAFLRTRQRIDDLVSRLCQRFSVAFSGIRSRMLASLTEVIMVYHHTEKGLQVFPSEGKLLLILPRPETEVLVMKSDGNITYPIPEPEEIMWLEFQESSQEMYLTCPRSMRKFVWDFSNKGKARLFFKQSEEALDLQLYSQGPMARILVAFLRTIYTFGYFVHWLKNGKK